MSDREDETWTLHRRSDGRLLADLVVTGGDWPWLHARVDPRVGFADVQPLFAEDVRLLDRVDEDVEEWERAYDAVRNAVTLRYPDRHEVAEFLLHIDGVEAWWRWSDEAFDEEGAQPATGTDTGQPMGDPSASTQ